MAVSLNFTPTRHALHTELQIDAYMEQPLENETLKFNPFQLGKMVILLPYRT